MADIFGDEAFSVFETEETKPKSKDTESDAKDAKRSQKWDLYRSKSENVQEKSLVELNLQNRWLSAHHTAELVYLFEP